MEVMKNQQILKQSFSLLSFYVTPNRTRHSWVLRIAIYSREIRSLLWGKLLNTENRPIMQFDSFGQQTPISLQLDIQDPWPDEET